MASVLSIRDGETYCLAELQTALGFKTDRSVKEWVTMMDVPFVAVQGKWWIAGEDLRKAMRLAAVTNTERREAKAEAV